MERGSFHYFVGRFTAVVLGTLMLTIWTAVPVSANQDPDIIQEQLYRYPPDGGEREALLFNENRLIEHGSYLFARIDVLDPEHDPLQLKVESYFDGVLQGSTDCASWDTPHPLVDGWCIVWGEDVYVLVATRFAPAIHGQYVINFRFSDDHGGTVVSSLRFTMGDCHNHAFAEDVDQNGIVEIADANILMDILRSQGAMKLTSGDQCPNFKPDTNGDGWLSPVDVLLISHYLYYR